MAAAFVPTPRPVRLEIAVQDIAGVRVARDQGADRVELCTALGMGGLTPSIGMIKAAVAERIPVHVLIRPRAGGFTYNSGDLGAALSDILAAVDAGAAGVVVGALTSNGAMDKVAMKEMIDAAQGIEMTFHRAIDVVEYPFALLDHLIEFGFARVLTSGQEPTVAAGMPMLGRFIKHVAGRIQIQAGGGLSVRDIPALVEMGVQGVHLSAKSVVADAGPVGPGGGPAEYDATDADLVRAAVEAVRAAERAVERERAVV